MKIVIIGSGNVATHLGLALKNVGYCIQQVYSRTEKNASALAEALKCEHTTEIALLYQNADLYLVAVGDKVIEQILAELTFEPKLIAHTAGSMPLQVLKAFENHGVFYPLQTFSKGRKIDISKVPICIEANAEVSAQLLVDVAKTISNDVRRLNSKERKQCHMAGVFANNFVNYFYGKAAEILDKKSIPFEILLPLIEETANKIKDLKPEEAQTGPAVRKDINVINEHRQFLSAYGLEELYSFVSESIMNKNREK